LVLAHAADHPALLARDTASVFAAARTAGLLAAADAAALGEAVRLIGDVQLWQRFTVEEAFDPAAVPARVLTRIATAVGRPDTKVLRAELDEVRSGVRAIFTRVLGSARAG
ncbi:MAG: bifunctional [glutamine synthetase] adenylyltransferase/[glutamine synthetase]-adenylyl-L-tyrosine phosphorylase, partial [Beijerinckiaceae bacterium]|nr:bifunctional [glutamine synthetase] adenylyltransferase/[glutamine synthetase]-adenylyl-L-tyrosine phosphorylase [Beijerinckiaceae bacterium]